MELWQLEHPSYLDITAYHLASDRYGLAIGYYCAWLVRGLMAITSPISWPIGKLLDFLLGHEHRALFR